MAELLRKNDNGNSSPTPGEVPVKFEKEVIGGSSSSGGELDGREAVGGVQLSNGGCNSPGTAGRYFPRVNTLPPEILSMDKLEPPSSQLKLEGSKTERHRPKNICAEEAAQIYNEKISVQQKRKLLNRIATVKDDGTVEFEVPGGVEHRAFAVGSENVYNEVDDDTPDTAELRYIPPLQIVMLIVGTRGDVQPFIAIGKRLQVLCDRSINKRGDDESLCTNERGNESLCIDGRG